MTPEETEALKESLALAKDYADAVVKGPLQQLGGILTDTVGYWRLKNQINVLLKAKQFLDSKGVDPGKILPDIFVPLVEHAANTSDETLQDMFARLLAGLIDPSWEEKPHPSFSGMIAQMTPSEAHLLREAFVLDPNHGREDWAESLNRRQTARVSQGLKDLDFRSQYLATGNLCRLGLLEETEKHDFRLTQYGFHFCDACMDISTELDRMYG